MITNKKHEVYSIYGMLLIFVLFKPLQAVVESSPDQPIRLFGISLDQGKRIISDNGISIRYSINDKIGIHGGMHMRAFSSKWRNSQPLYYSFGTDLIVWQGTAFRLKPSIDVFQFVYSEILEGTIIRNTSAHLYGSVSLEYCGQSFAIDQNQKGSIWKRVRNTYFFQLGYLTQANDISPSQIIDGQNLLYSLKGVPNLAVCVGILMEIPVKKWSGQTGTKN